MRKRKQQEAIKSVSLFVSMVSAKVFLFFVLSLFRLISQTIMDDDGDVMGGMMFDDEGLYLSLSCYFFVLMERMIRFLRGNHLKVR